MADKIRVLYVDTCVALAGGQISLLEILSSLGNAAVEPLVAVPPGSELETHAHRMGFNVVPLPFSSTHMSGGGGGGAGDYMRSLRGVFSLMGSIRTLAIDIVHANTFKAALVSGFAARLTRTPMVYHERAMITHGPLDRLVTGMATRIIAVSEAVRAKHPRLGDNRIRVIQPGVDTAALVPDWERPPARTACFIGRLNEEKGLDVLVEAAPQVLSEVPDARFVLCGSPFTGDDASYEAGLRSRIAELGLADRFEFPGFVADVRGPLGAADLLVLPSRRDAAPRAVFEAMALGKPVVATNVGGIPERVMDGKTGLLVEPDDAAGLGRSIAMLLSDRELALRMGREGRRFVEAGHSRRAATAGVVDLYAEMMGAAGATRA